MNVRIEINGVQISGDVLTTSIGNGSGAFAVKSVASFYAKEGDIVTVSNLYLVKISTGQGVSMNDFGLSSLDSISTYDRNQIRQYGPLPIFDTTLNKLVYYNGSAWVNMDGSALS